ncbi:hypothetical protein D4R87_02450 [bacterium]|nr:MAG: hypothetical protein D4R87_02450 [bacterium]
MTNLIKVRPSEIDTKNDLMGSEFEKSEKETIARNIIIISRQNNNQWFSFSWEDYCNRCSHSPTGSEYSILNEFVREGLLDFINDKYNVKDAFIAKLWKFVKPSKN